MKKFHRAIVLVILMTAFLAGGCRKSRSGWGGAVEEIDGVTIVRNPEEPVDSAVVFTAEEEISFGDEEGDETYAFSDISHLTADDQGRIYVLDRKESHVKVFDREAKYLRTIGRPGQGPGDLNGPVFIYFLGNELLVTQYERLSFFSPEGELLRTVPMIKESPSRARPNSRGNILGTSSSYDSQTPEVYYSVLKLYDPELNPIKELARIRLERRPNVVDPVRTSVYMTVNDQDEVIFGYPDQYEIQVFGPDGNLSRRIIKAYRPVAITEEEKAALIEGAPPQIKFEFPEHYPPYVRFIHDEEGRLYVQTYEKGDGRDVFYHDVFDREGRYIAKVPLRRFPVVIRGGKLYSLEESDEGYPVVKRYGITWKF